MKKDLIIACCGASQRKSINLQKGVYLVHYYNKNFIVKNKTGGFIGKVKQLNENNFYQNQNLGLKYLRIPKFIGICPDKRLVISFIEGKEFKKVPPEIFIPAYLEFQRIKNNAISLFDHAFRLLRGFFYRISIVAVFTISRKTNFIDSLKIISLHSILNLQQQKFNRYFRMHGDLYCSNMIKDDSNNLVLIDFENTFLTKKWPLAELIHLCFYFENKILQFSESYLLEYLHQLEPGYKNQLMQKNCLKRQIRFGMLYLSIGQIAQTKGKLKKDSYLELLDIVLKKQDFENWYELHINTKIKNY